MEHIRKKLFISHASEDKAEVARPLTNALIKVGFLVWLDEFALVAGDSLKRKIEEGLKQCDYGIVILSDNFFAKHWPQEELDGLFAIESYKDKILIIPVWHNIGFDKMLHYSPILAGRKGILSNIGIPKIVSEILKTVNRSELSYRGLNDTEQASISVGWINEKHNSSGGYAGFTDTESMKFLLEKTKDGKWRDFGKAFLKEIDKLDTKKGNAKKTTKNKHA